MPELNPVTRMRLWYITLFFAADGLIALCAGIALPGDNPWAIPAFVLGAVSFVAGGAIGSFLFATREVQKDDIHAVRRRE
jgi:hypothetical protein